VRERSGKEERGEKREIEGKIKGKGRE